MERKIRGVNRRDFDRIAVSRIISASRFRDGGAAIFVAVAMNHHIVILGRSVRNPLVRNRLREFVDS